MCNSASFSIAQLDNRNITPSSHDALLPTLITLALTQSMGLPTAMEPIPEHETVQKDSQQSHVSQTAAEYAFHASCTYSYTDISSQLHRRTDCSRGRCPRSPSLQVRQMHLRPGPSSTRDLCLLDMQPTTSLSRPSLHTCWNLLLMLDLMSRRTQPSGIIPEAKLCV